MPEKMYGRTNGTVQLSVEQTPVGGTWPVRPGVVLAVADQGAGIAREHLPRLTERFYRVDKGRSRAVGGTGLGLAIVKHVAANHNGTIGLWSQLGTGSTFTLSIPAYDAECEQLDQLPEREIRPKMPQREEEIHR